MSQRLLRSNGLMKLPSGRYQIDYRDRDGVRHRESFDREKQARATLDEKRTRIREGEYIPPQNIPTFEEMAGRWLEEKKHNAGRDGKPVKETTLLHWDNHIRLRLIPTLGKYRLDRITTDLIEEMRFRWRDSGKTPLSPATVNKLLTTTAAIFDEAIRLGKTKHNPASKAKRLGVGSVEAQGNGEKDGQEVRPEQVYTPDELNRLIEAATPGLYQTIIMTIALTGIRHGEALGLQWGDIDLEVGKITIRRTWPNIYRDNEPVFYIPKSKNAVREIPIPPELISALKKWKLSCPVSKWDLVFPKKDGRPRDRKTILSCGFYPAHRRAKIKKLDIHALRHSYASILLAHSTPITEVSAYLGHANPQITLQVYSHWLPRTKTDSISKLAEAIFNSGKKPLGDQVGHLKDTSGDLAQEMDDINLASAR